MQPNDLVELAALVSAETPGLLAAGQRLSAAGIDAYWTASKCRLDRWSRRLTPAHRSIKSGLADDSVPYQGCCSTCSEVLTSEVLTRVWVAAATGSDRLRRQSELAPVARSVLFGHQEARLRVLNLIAAGIDLKQRRAEQLDRLRRISERWTDLLLAPLAEWCDIAPFAHDPSRAGDFRQDRLDERGSPCAARARAILNASLRSAFRRWAVSPNHDFDLNARIASSVLACLNLDRVNPVGLESATYSWLFRARVTSATSIAERLLDELLNRD